MSIGAKVTGTPTSAAHDAFLLAFETADIVSLYWQPFLKNIGRWQLEMAQAGARQSRAALEFGHCLAQASNPFDVVNAQARYWEQVGQAYSDANQHITQALTRTTQMPAGSEVIAAAKKRPHDTLRLEDRTVAREYEHERKVA